MAADAEKTSGTPTDADLAPGERLVRTNALLAEWAACAAADSAPLIDRLEGLGYPVRGKSREEVEAILKGPPAQA